MSNVFVWSEQDSCKCDGFVLVDKGLDGQIVESMVWKGSDNWKNVFVCGIVCFCILSPKDSQVIYLWSLNFFKKVGYFLTYAIVYVCL